MNTWMIIPKDVNGLRPDLLPMILNIPGVVEGKGGGNPIFNGSLAEFEELWPGDLEAHYRGFFIVVMYD